MQSSRMRLMQRGVHSSGQPQGCGLHTHPVDVEVVQPADTRKYYPIQQLLLTCPDSSCRLLAYTQHVVMLQQKHSYQQQLRLTCPDSSYCPLSRRAVRCWTLACTPQGRRRAIRLQLVQTQACHSATHRRAAAGMPLCCSSGQREPLNRTMHLRVSSSNRAHQCSHISSTRLQALAGCVHIGQVVRPQGQPKAADAHRHRAAPRVAAEAMPWLSEDVI